MEWEDFKNCKMIKNSFVYFFDFSDFMIFDKLTVSGEHCGSAHGDDVDDVAMSGLFNDL